MTANVGIDPEMLGHIFENLLEENKDKRAYLHILLPFVSQRRRGGVSYHLADVKGNAFPEKSTVSFAN
jgi:hypothetical protein